MKKSITQKEVANKVKCFFKGFIKDIKDNPVEYACHAAIFLIGASYGKNKGWNNAEKEFDRQYRENIYNNDGSVTSMSTREYKKYEKEYDIWHVDVIGKDRADLALKLLKEYDEKQDSSK